MQQPQPYPYTQSPYMVESKALKKTGNFVAFILLAMLAMQLLLRALSSVGLLDIVFFWADGHATSLIANMITYVLSLAVPAVLVAQACRCGIKPFPSKPVSGTVFSLGVAGGMAVAIFANVVAGWLMAWMSALGVPQPEMPDMLEPTAMSFVLNLIYTGVLAAVVEEMVFRGYILGALRAHGDGIAVVVSAALFGLFHGNVLQLPFAFLLGLALGYLVVKTDSIWPSVLLHFINNAMSVTLTFLEKRYGMDGNAITLFTFSVVSLVGAAALTVVAVCRQPFTPLTNGLSLFRVSTRVGKLLTAPAMVAALIILFWNLLVSMGVV